jgi:hypothetical protein
MNPLEKYVEHADGLAQEVVNAWCINVRAGNAGSFTPEFKSLFDKACDYRTAKQIANCHREYGLLREQEAIDEKTKREAFAREFKDFKALHENL